MNQLALATTAEHHYDSEGGHITDLVLPSHPGTPGRSARTLSAILKGLSDSDTGRWICWVSQRTLQPGLLHLDTSERNSSRILQVLPKQSQDLIELAKRALLSGRSDTVALCIEEPISAEQRQSLEQAATQGGSECLLIQIRPRLH